MIRVSISMCGVVLLLSVLLPIMPVDAQRDEATVAANWTFNNGSVKDTSKKGLNGNFTGKPKAVDGIAGKALKFNGKDDGIKIPDSADINTVGPYTDRTVAALFNCDDAADFAAYAASVVSVEPKDKFTTTWADIKAQRTLR